jgi:PAS domain S-box-containing protein
MTHRARFWRSVTSALLPFATGALATVIFVAQAMTSEKLTAALFYIFVVLLAVRFCNARGVLLVGAGCVVLTVIAFFFPGFTETDAGNVGAKASISAAVIGLTTLLALQSRSAEATLREQAAILDLTHDSIVARRFDDDLITYWNRGAEELYGWRRGEAVGRVGSEFRKTVAPLPLDEIKTELLRVGRWDGELVNNRRDGTPVLVASRWSLQRDRHGRPATMVVTSNDITERRRGEQRVAAQHAVTRILAEADSLAAAAPHLLRAIGEKLEWDWGSVWSFDWERDRDAAPLRCDALWRAPDVETAEIDRDSREWVFASGEGLVGQVWRTAKPIWMSDATTQPGFLRAEAVARDGLHGGVIFPVLLDARALAVIEFFSRAARERDEEQLATLLAIGSQIGQFIQRRRAEAALHASEERWRKLFETSSAGMGLFRLDGVCTAANSALQRMLGRAENEIVGHNVLELNHEDERAATAEALARYRSGTLTERNVEKKYVKKDGNTLWLNITNTLVPATETAPPFLQAVYIDVTERVKFELALRASDERWRAMFETTTIGIATSDLGLRYVTANQSFQQMTGYTEEELRNLTPMDITHEDDRTAMLERIDDLAGGPRRGHRVEKRLRRKDGEIVWADINTFFVPATDSTPAFLGGMAVDITDRKRAEEALRDAEERFRTLVQFSFDVYWESDAQHRFIRQEFAEGLADAPAPGSEIGLTRWEVPYVEPDEEAWRKHRETLDAHLPFRDFEHARPTPDGGKRYVSVSGLPVFDEAGRFMGYRGVGRHITDRKRAEAALRASEERWRCMFEIAPVGIVTIDFERRRYVTANASFQQMTGYTEAELRNLTTLELTYEDDRAAMQERIDSGTVGVLQRKRYRRKDGEVVWADVTSFVIPATDSTPAFRGAVIVDITDRKRAEAALQQAQADLARLNRIMLLGEMTASIAHEVNQPIAATVTNAHAGLRWLGAPQPDLDEVRQALGRIVRDGTRAGEVINRIRALVKKVPPSRDPLDINEAIREVIALTQTEMQRTGVRLQSRLAQDLPLVSADRVQLHQVMINLIVNAIEAMAGTSNGSRELTIVSGLDAVKDVFIEVQDTGPGLDPEKLDRLFQSFYTTKPDGIGMGLAISRSIVEAHGGRLLAMQNQPRGANFRFTLPPEQTLSGSP